MYRGALPWKRFDPKREAKKVYELKKEWLDEKIWEAKFEELLPLCQILEDLHVTEFNEMPPYEKIKNELDKLKKHRYYRREALDWIIEENGFDMLWKESTKKARKSH